MYNVSSFHLAKGRAASTSRRADESLSVASNDSPEMTTSHPQPQPNDVSISTFNIIHNVPGHIKISLVLLPLMLNTLTTNWL